VFDASYGNPLLAQVSGRYWPDKCNL